MRAVVLRETGDPDVLAYEEVPSPPVGADEVRIRVERLLLDTSELAPDLVDAHAEGLVATFLPGLARRTSAPGLDGD